MKTTSFCRKPKRSIIARFSLALALPLMASAQEKIPLYTDTVPNAKVQTAPENDGELDRNGWAFNVIRPTLEIYLPTKENATGTAVVICPGGGYSGVAYTGEGTSVAKEFVKQGVAAFVLKYRLPSDTIMDDKTIGPLQDAQRAIQLVRENAEKWDLDPHKIGIVGFSAGGHLASTAATHYQQAQIPNKKETSLRPDFQILVYPVITMEKELTHKGSRENLLGTEPSEKIVRLYSNELQIDDKTPPAYLVHTADDTTVDVDNSIHYFEQLRKNKVPVEMQIKQKGGHGFATRSAEWMVPMFKWMKESKWID